MLRCATAQVKVTAEWISGGNSAVDGGGALQEGDTFFKRSRFTLYANVKFDAAHDNTSALLVGSDAGANFRIVPCKTDGTAVLKVNNGTEYKLSKAMAAGDWNALALVYAENDTEGTVAVYLNGEEVLPATGIGFKLSEKSGIVGAVGATFGTGFMRTGLYDELVVTGAADAEAAKAAVPAAISSTCTVFAESEVISQLSMGTDKRDIINGIHRSVASRVAGLAHRVGIRDQVVMTGGVAQNSGVVKALEEALGHEVHISPLTQYNGALGAALFAYQKYQKAQRA